MCASDVRGAWCDAQLGTFMPYDILQQGSQREPAVLQGMAVHKTVAGFSTSDHDSSEKSRTNRVRG